MNQKKIDQVNDELNKLDDIIEKLDFWRMNYLVKYPGNLLHNYFETKTKEQLNSNFSDGFLGVIRLPISGLTNRCLLAIDDVDRTQSIDYKIKYYRWELYYEAEQDFLTKLMPFYDKEINKNLGEEKLTGIIKKNELVIKNALKLLEVGKIDVDHYANITQEKLYLWYKQDIYSENIIWKNQEEEHIKAIMTYHFELPYIKSIVKIKEEKEFVAIMLKNIDLDKLLANLKYRGYYDDSDHKEIKNWFSGIPIKSKIHINKPMYYFVSVIFSLEESKHIKNAIKQIIKSIRYSFLFKNRMVALSSITNALKKGSSNRISETDKDNYIDISDFIIKR